MASIRLQATKAGGAGLSVMSQMDMPTRTSSVGAKLARDGDFKDAIASKLCSYIEPQ
ncbi:hypothetical protein HK44_015495 [Pseudomonas fluorescens HK44]|uniref:Uncharacterized protein n=1 Tax=Pseudomonas fluorescens HK44 TaxID=1042209 RepID=A0A010RHS6_PSEFL|nr:hypothetical protein HK44_015495 [Pseudomonas fluorescens HK44]